MTFIFTSLGIKCVPYISQVIPSFINVIRTAESSFKDFLFQQLATLISIVKQHIRNYLDDIFKLIKVYFCNNVLSTIYCRTNIFIILKMWKCDGRNLSFCNLARKETALFIK